MPDAGDIVCSSKRPRLMVPKQEYSFDITIDYLKKLYPHSRDANCEMDEKEHIYRVLDEKYQYSVSSVWKVFFPDFPNDMANSCLQKSAEQGLRCLEMSVYNFCQYLHLSCAYDVYGEEFDSCLENAVARAERVCKENDWQVVRLEDVRGVVEQIFDGWSFRRPDKNVKSCYFLSSCYGLTGEDLEQQWKNNAGLEALKGTFLHKQAELYMQALAKVQIDTNRKQVPLKTLLAEPQTLEFARETARPEIVVEELRKITCEEQLHMLAVQAFFAKSILEKRSVEFVKFENWLFSHPELTPFRSEWSIYDAGYKIAGQIDSLWLDTEKDMEIVMVDWKRAKHLLSPDIETQRQQSFKKRALNTCSSSSLESPCKGMYDVDYNHYSAQQNLYNYMHNRNYAYNEADPHWKCISSAYLVQCHPDVGEKEAFNEVQITLDSKIAEDMLVAFYDGWKERLCK